MNALIGSKNESRFNLQSWLTLALAIAFIVTAIIYLFLAFQQPSDGWLYQTRLDGNLIAVGSVLDQPGPLQPGDQVLAIENQPASLVLVHPIPAPPGWLDGGSGRYTILRAGKQFSLLVPLHTRPFRSIFRSFSINQTFLPTNLLWYLIGFTVFILRPRETAAGLLLLITTYWSTMDTFVSADANPAFYYYPGGLAWTSIILNSLWLFLFALIIHFLLVFPIRKWPLTRYPRLALIVLYGLPAAGTILTLGFNELAFTNIVLALMALTTVATLILTAIHSLRNLHSPVVRAQLGWVMLGIGAPLVGGVISFAFSSMFPDLDTTRLNGAWSLLSVMLPLGFGIAITRYRLFDISLIIRRTLVYSLLTLCLGLVYFGVVVILQNLFGILTGERQSNLIIVVSTLIIAALFTPLRNRLQDFIDRRFYRRKYDAEHTLRSVGALIRDEVELESLTDYLENVIRETMHPESVSIWLNPRKPT